MVSLPVFMKEKCDHISRLFPAIDAEGHFTDDAVRTYLAILYMHLEVFNIYGVDVMNGF